VLSCLERGAQLAHLLGESSVVVPQASCLATGGGHFLGKHRQNPPQAAESVEHLVALTGLRDDRVGGEARGGRSGAGAVGSIGHMSSG
jgi:hypothetical protein